MLSFDVKIAKIGPADLDLSPRNH